MIKQITYVFLFLLVGNVLYAQQGRYGLSFANEQTTSSTLCVDIQLRFKNGGKLGSSNLVMKYNKTRLANPVFSTSNLPAANYSIATVTNPVDSLASFNIELLTENNGLTIATAPAKTTVGQLCFDVLAGLEASFLDWHIKNTVATVIYLDDESTQLIRGKIEVLCNNVGQTCDDGNANTTDDKYDINCVCTGTQMDCVDDINVNEEAIPSRTYKSRMKITSQGRIRPNADVAFKAAQTITLNAGFHAEEGSNFLAVIEDCVDNTILETVQGRNSEADEFPILTNNQLTDLSLTVYPNPIGHSASITYILPKTEKVAIGIYSLQGALIQPIFNGVQTEGMHLVDWQASDFPSGMYFLVMMTLDSRVVQKVVLQ